MTMIPARFLTDLPKMVDERRVFIDDGCERRGSNGALGVQFEGIVQHHTAGRWHDKAGNVITNASVGILRNGRSDLPPPLVQLYGNRANEIRVMALGLCNHAGIGSSVALADIRAGREIWQTAKQRGLRNDQGGNRFYAGIEWENDGIGEPWTTARIDLMGRVTALLLQYGPHGRNATLRHADHTDRKTDPNLPKDAWWAAIDRAWPDAVRVVHGTPVPVPAPVPAPKPAPIPEPAPKPEPAPRTVLTIDEFRAGAGKDGVLAQGDEGDAVRSLQALLVARGDRLVVDGRFGAVTRQAVAELQLRLGAAKGAPTLGMVGEFTARRIGLVA